MKPATWFQNTLMEAKAFVQQQFYPLYKMLLFPLMINTAMTFCFHSNWSACYFRTNYTE